jgi:hypothetical protein
MSTRSKARDIPYVAAKGGTKDGRQGRRRGEWVRPKMPEEKLLVELERIVAEQDRQSAGNGRPSVNAIADVFNESLAEAIVDEATRLGQKLTDLGILGDGAQGDVVLSPEGKPFEWWVQVVDGGEPRLYSWVGVDGVLVTRVREDGHREQTTLDEHGMPVEWRVGDKRPGLGPRGSELN